MTLLFGGTIVGAHLFLEGCSREASPAVAELFNDDYVDYLGNIAETILPTTDTPGAKEAGVGTFIPVMIRDCYTAEEQEIFLNGLADIDKKCKEMFGNKFQKLDQNQRTEILTALDKERMAYQKEKKPEEPVHYFAMLRQLAVLGFFTSEIGATKALRYVAIPGKYDGDFPYKKGDRAWAT